MNSIALARRYRPKTLHTLKGQDATVRALTNALQSQKLHHGYLFTGTRGVGKTSVARILAKCLNCETGITPTPCEQCSTCREIDEGRFVDVLEVDAASRTKVEDTRDLLDNVQYLPTRGRFKIYLIDEVHMLSSHSFNALLKTLEEPPSHVKFLLATTDPQKLPLTILSRCLQFHLHRLPVPQIVDHLKHILEQENASFEVEALQILAASADGSMRDALSLLDQVLAYGQGHVEMSAVRTMLGLTPKGCLISLLDALIAGNTQEIFSIIHQIADLAPDFAMVLNELLTLLHQIALAKQCPEILQEEVIERQSILRLTEKLLPEEIQLYYQIALHGNRDMPYAPNAKMGFEMTMLRMLAFRPVKVCEVSQPVTTVSGSMTTKTNAVSNAISNAAEPIQQFQQLRHHEVAKTADPIPQVRHPRESGDPGNKRNSTLAVDSRLRGNDGTSNGNDGETEGTVKERTPNKGTSTSSNSNHSNPSNLSNSNWADLLPQLNLTGLVKELAQHCSVASWTREFVHLILDESKSTLLNKRYEDRLADALRQHFGWSPESFRFKITATPKKPGQPPTPAEQGQQLKQESELKAKQMLEADPKVKNLIETFGAEIEQTSMIEEK